MKRATGRKCMHRSTVATGATPCTFYGSHLIRHTQAVQYVHSALSYAIPWAEHVNSSSIMPNMWFWLRCRDAATLRGRNGTTNCLESDQVK